MEENQTVTLKQVKAGTEQQFGFQHALNLLRYQDKTGREEWRISDKNWQYKKNEIIRSNRKPKNSEK